MEFELLQDIFLYATGICIKTNINSFLSLLVLEHYCMCEDDRVESLSVQNTPDAKFFEMLDSRSNTLSSLVPPSPTPM